MDLMTELGRAAALARDEHVFLERAQQVLASQPPASPAQRMRLDSAVADLATAVRERARVERAQRMRALADFARGVVHDFNNLLGVIVNFAEFVAEELPAGSQAADDLHQVRQGAEGAVALSDRLGQVTGNRLPDPDGVRVEDALPAVEAALPEGVRLDRRVDTSRTVPLDQAALTAVLSELAANACAAMPDGGTLEIEAAEDGGCVRVRVRDSGTGMEPEVAARALEPYFTTHRKGRGAGLGLTTAYWIVVCAGGELDITSTPGSGTTVDVVLPVTERG